MPPKSSDNRVDSMEREMKNIRNKLQRLPGLEMSMEHMAQNFVKLMQTLEETQRTIQSLKSSQDKEKAVLEEGEPSSLPEGTLLVGNTRKSVEEYGGGLKERSRREPIVLDGLNDHREPWRGGRRLEMLVFNGGSPEGWIFRAELYFEMNQLTELEKLMATRVSFEDEALA